MLQTAFASRLLQLHATGTAGTAQLRGRWAVLRWSRPALCAQSLSLSLSLSASPATTGACTARCLSLSSLSCVSYARPCVCNRAALPVALAAAQTPTGGAALLTGVSASLRFSSSRRLAASAAPFLAAQGQGERHQSQNQDHLSPDASRLAPAPAHTIAPTLFSSVLASATAPSAHPPALFQSFPDTDTHRNADTDTPPIPSQEKVEAAGTAAEAAAAAGGDRAPSSSVELCECSEYPTELRALLRATRLEVDLKASSSVAASSVARVVELACALPPAHPSTAALARALLRSLCNSHWLGAEPSERVFSLLAACGEPREMEQRRLLMLYVRLGATEKAWEFFHRCSAAWGPRFRHKECTRLLSFLSLKQTGSLESARTLDGMQALGYSLCAFEAVLEVALRIYCMAARWHALLDLFLQAVSASPQTLSSRSANFAMIACHSVTCGGTGAPGNYWWDAVEPAMRAALQLPFQDAVVLPFQDTVVLPFQDAVVPVPGVLFYYLRTLTQQPPAPPPHSPRPDGLSRWSAMRAQAPLLYQSLLARGLRPHARFEELLAQLAALPAQPSPSEPALASAPPSADALQRDERVAELESQCLTTDPFGHAIFSDAASPALVLEYIDLLTRRPQFSVQLNEQFHRLFHALVSACPALHPPLLFAAFRAYQLCGIPRLSCFRSMLRATLQLSPPFVDDALSLFRFMLQNHMHPLPECVALLLRALGVHRGDTQGAKELLEGVASLKCPGTEEPYDCHPHVQSAMVLVHSCAGDMQRARELYETVFQSRNPLRASDRDVAMVAFLEACARHKDLTGGRFVWEQLRKAKQPVSPLVACKLLALVHEACGQRELALEVWDSFPNARELERSQTHVLQRTLGRLFRAAPPPDASSVRGPGVPPTVRQQKPQRWPENSNRPSPPRTTHDHGRSTYGNSKRREADHQARKFK